MNLLVCGGRTYGEAGHDKPKSQQLLEIGLALDILEAIDRRFSVRTVTHGGARGGDRIAAHWCMTHGKIENKFPALWGSEGYGAGPMRNRRMRDHARPDLVLALPGGSGTFDMAEIAREEGIKLIRVV